MLLNQLIIICKLRIFVAPLLNCSRYRPKCRRSGLSVSNSQRKTFKDKATNVSCRNAPRNPVKVWHVSSVSEVRLFLPSVRPRQLPQTSPSAELTQRQTRAERSWRCLCSRMLTRWINPVRSAALFSQTQISASWRRGPAARYFMDESRRKQTTARWPISVWPNTANDLPPFNLLLARVLRESHLLFLYSPLIVSFICKRTRLSVNRWVGLLMWDLNTEQLISLSLMHSPDKALLRNAPEPVKYFHSK